MSNLPLPGDDKKPKGPSTARVVIWIIVGGIGVWMVVSGLMGVMNGGS